VTSESVPAVAAGIDHERVSRWLVDHVEGAVAPFAYDQIPGGRSNLTFCVTGADGERCVLRRPPLGSVLATAHDMAREHRIISAVVPTGVPVPVTLGLCTDDSVNGAPFYVMSYVDGLVLDSQAAAMPLDTEVRAATATHLIDVLADLHAVDVDAVGLGDLAKRDGYVERQLRRWTRQWEQSKTRDLASVDEAAARLAERLPVQQGVSIAHGDYRLGNCLVDPSAGSIAAVLDWELCTLGDPLADVGYLGVHWAEPGTSPRTHNDPSGLDGFPTYDELLARYAARSGRDLEQIAYYVAFSSWRLAIISEGVYARYAAGVMGPSPDPAVVEGFKQGTVDLVDAALAVLDGGLGARRT
jgi:aminoglycoside phosphotransferase (APT) family kinase protein